MSRQRNPKRDESRKLYLESRGKLTPKEIAEQLNVSPSLISKWKSQDKWEDILNGKTSDLPYGQSNSKGKTESNGKGKSNRQNYQAPKGNQFARGNKGNRKPKTGNKNAVTHGLYETISFDYLSADEKDMVINMMAGEYNPLRKVEETIVELQIRKRRMMRRIQELEENLSPSEIQTVHRLRWDKDIVVEHGMVMEKEVEHMKEVERYETTKTVSDILLIEEALTRVTDSLLRAIKTRNDMLLESDGGIKYQYQELKNKKLQQELDDMAEGGSEDEPLVIELINKTSRGDE